MKLVSTYERALTMNEIVSFFSTVVIKVNNCRQAPHFRSGFLDCIGNEKNETKQGILAQGKGSVQMTSLLV
jgi:hypothetical protein